MVRAEPAARFTCFLDERAAAAFTLEHPAVRRVVVRQRVSPTLAAAAESARAPGDMLRLSRAVSREALDVFFSPSVYTYFPLPPRLRAVVTLHDAIAERFPALTLPTRRARLFWRAKVGLALRQARLVLTVSEHAARDLERVLGVPRSRIRVATEAPADAYRRDSTPAEIGAARAAAGIPAGARWFTYVGGFNPHKHVDLLVRAHAAVAAGRADPPHLVLVGAVSGDAFHGAHAAIQAAIAEAGTASLVHWTGFLPDEALRPLLAGGVALALVSAAEGFGLPAVEAAAAGSAIIATTESPLPELLAGGGHFVAPGVVAPLADALRSLLDDEAARRAMAARARERARALTWDAGARATLAALHEAAA